LSIAEAEAWKQEIYDLPIYPELITHHHISTILTVDQLQSLKSVTHYDGEKVVEIFQFFFQNIIVTLGTFFKNWMQCKMRPEHNTCCKSLEKKSLLSFQSLRRNLRKRKIVS
jgi:hypothetical protein